LEYMGTDTVTLVVFKDYKAKAQWTIYDVSDLYYVLPGFISMVGSDTYRNTFLSSGEHSRLFLDILKMFINHHRNQGYEAELDMIASSSSSSSKMRGMEDSNNRSLAAAPHPSEGMV
jgi:hypothetical protein